jgi:hypothetical protein
MADQEPLRPDEWARWQHVVSIAAAVVRTRASLRTRSDTSPWVASSGGATSCSPANAPFCAGIALNNTGRPPLLHASSPSAPALLLREIAFILSRVLVASPSRMPRLTGYIYGTVLCSCVPSNIVQERNWVSVVRTILSRPDCHVKLYTNGGGLVLHALMFALEGTGRVPHCWETQDALRTLLISMHLEWCLRRRKIEGVNFRQLWGMRPDVPLEAVNKSPYRALEHSFPRGLSDSTAALVRFGFLPAVATCLARMIRMRSYNVRVTSLPGVFLKSQLLYSRCLFFPKYLGL